MTSQSRTVERTSLLLTLLTTLAASFIWGINTLFLPDAGLNNTDLARREHAASDLIVEALSRRRARTRRQPPEATARRRRARSVRDNPAMASCRPAFTSTPRPGH